MKHKVKLSRNEVSILIDTVRNEIERVNKIIDDEQEHFYQPYMGAYLAELEYLEDELKLVYYDGGKIVYHGK